MVLSNLIFVVSLRVLFVLQTLNSPADLSPGALPMTKRVSAGRCFPAGAAPGTRNKKSVHFLLLGRYQKSEGLILSLYKNRLNTLDESKLSAQYINK